MSDLDPVLKDFPACRENLIPILHAVQHRERYISAEAIEQVAKYLEISASSVYGVATFYSAFKLKPEGEQTIRVCRGTACHVKGADNILRELETRLGIKEGETTTDGKYTLRTEACFGSCALAPVVVNDKVFGRVTPSSISRVLRGKS